MNPDQSRASIAFDFCTITGRFDTSPKFNRSSFDGLVDFLRSHTRVVMTNRSEYLTYDKGRQATVKDGPAIILARFTEDGKRTDANVQYTTGIGLDIDCKHLELEQLLGYLEGVTCIIYESANSTPQFRRWRVLIPFSAPATLEEHDAAFNYWSACIPGIGAQSRNASRLWYVVTQFRDQPKRMFEVIYGKTFDVRTALGKPSDPVAATQAAFMRTALPVGLPAAEGNRNGELNRYATSIVSQCDSESELLGMLLEKNDTYAPPLPEGEVRGMAKRKWAHRTQFGWVPAAAEATQVEGSPDEPDVGVDAAALFDTDHGAVPWVIDSVLTCGAHLLVGRAKGGKSWMTMDMALCVGAGGEFVGHACQQGSVLWISGEDTRASLSRRLKVRGERPRNVRIMTMEDIGEERAHWDAAVTFHDWLGEYLKANPSVRLVIIDTHKTVEAKWNNEQIDTKRFASVVDIAYQDVRFYETIGKTLQRAIVLVHHQGKMKHNSGTDYHERVNLPATVVAGVSASLVLSDHPERDLHDEDDRRRVFSTRGRDIVKDENLLIEFVEGRVKLLGAYAEIAQTEAQAEIFETVEALLNESETTTIAAVAQAMGKHKNTVQMGLKRAAKRPGGMQWKGRTLKLKQGAGLYWG